MAKSIGRCARPTHGRARSPLVAIAAAVFASAAFVSLGGDLLRQAVFLAAPARLSRRGAAQGALLLLSPLAPLATAPHEARAQLGDPLPPPVLKDVVRAAPKIQEGADWLYFELKPALDNKDLPACRAALGSAMSGSYVSPLESDLMIPLEQLISANLDAKEEGWIDAVRMIRDGIDSMKDHVGGGEWKEALDAWENARAGANKMMVQINERAEKAYFIALDANYETKRRDVYIQKKKDMMNFRNAAGTLALR